MGEKLSRIIAGDFGIWDIVAILGLLSFFGRFMVQWIASEIRKESVIPVAFWYMSIVGSLLLLSYGLHIEDRWFILGYVFNSFIYVRNLYFVYSKKNNIEQD